MKKKKNNKTKNILIRVTPEEKDNIDKIAKEKNTTVTALILNSIENDITVNLDTSDYRDLVIQFRRIGNNINNIIRNIHFSNYFTNSDILTIENNLEEIKKKLNDEKIKINKTKKDFQNLTPRKLRSFLEKEKKEVPIYLIYDEIADQINKQLKYFIQLIENEKLNPIFSGFINAFIENFYPTDYQYEELVSFSNDLDKTIYKINQKVITETGRLTEDDFMNVMDVLNKYRKNAD